MLKAFCGLHNQPMSQKSSSHNQSASQDHSENQNFLLEFTGLNDLRNHPLGLVQQAQSQCDFTVQLSENEDERQAGHLGYLSETPGRHSRPRWF